MSIIESTHHHRAEFDVPYLHGSITIHSYFSSSFIFRAGLSINRRLDEIVEVLPMESLEHSVPDIDAICGSFQMETTPAGNGKNAGICELLCFSAAPYDFSCFRRFWHRHGRHFKDIHHPRSSKRIHEMENCL